MNTDKNRTWIRVYPRPSVVSKKSAMAKARLEPLLKNATFAEQKATMTALRHRLSDVYNFSIENLTKNKPRINADEHG